MEKIAQEIIALEQRERGRQSNFRTLWQDTADLMYPRENQIVDTTVPGQVKTDRIFDLTAVMESANMASGLAQNLVPPGQRFFALKSSDRKLREVDNVKRYLSTVTELVHDNLFASNFMLQLIETLRSLVVFGTGNLYSEFKTKLNFKDYPIGTYQILESSEGLVDTMILKFPMEARQAAQEFENPGKLVEEALKSDKTKKFEFIHIVRPRKERDVTKKNNLNMPFESIYVSVSDQDIVDEGGFDEFPYHTPRWMKSSSERYGRGQGTEILPQVRVANQMMADFIEMGNKFVNPPLEVLESFEGEVKTTPSALNFVQERGSIGAVQQNALGNFPIGKDIIDMQREIIKAAFYSQAFAPLTDLSGDRRTTLEIRQRVQESFKKIGSPIGRIQSELFTPLITRVVMLLLRNGKLPPVPEELAGSDFSIEYVGPLSLALRSSEVEASQQWIGIVSEIEQISPGVIDNIDMDDSVRRMARAFGVNEEDIASEEEVIAKREAKAQLMQERRAAEMAQMAGKAYPGSTKAPESGSPAEALMNS